jgi:hypothetical protein
MSAEKCRCFHEGCAATVDVPEGTFPSGWVLVHVGAPRLWLCPEHDDGVLDAMSALVADVWQENVDLCVFRARIERLVQWGEGQHDAAFDDDALVATVGRYAREHVQRKGNLQ